MKAKCNALWIVAIAVFVLTCQGTAQAEPLVLIEVLQLRGFPETVVESMPSAPTGVTTYTIAADGRSARAVFTHGGAEMSDWRAFDSGEREITIIASEQGKVAVVMRIQFDSAGQRLYEIMEDVQDGNQYYIEHAYNGSYDMAEVRQYDGSDARGSLVSVGRKHFDGGGNAVRIDLLGIDGSLMRYTEVTYNEHGFVSEESEYEASGELRYRTRYEYLVDEVGNWTTRSEQRWDPLANQFSTTKELWTRDIKYR